MKKVLSILCVAILLASCNNQPAADANTEASAVDSTANATYTLNTDSTSTVKWKGVMLGVKEHFGTLAFKEGSVTVANGALSAGSFTVDMGTIKPTDSNYDEKSGYTQTKLVGHLSSPDFFDVTTHPTATFVISSVEGNSAKGTLTVRGKANEETLTGISISEANGVLTASGQLKFDRKKYDVKFDTGAKDMVISDEIELNISLTAHQ